MRSEGTKSGFTSPEYQPGMAVVKRYRAAYPGIRQIMREARSLPIWCSDCTIYRYSLYIEIKIGIPNGWLNQN